MNNLTYKMKMGNAGLSVQGIRTAIRSGEEQGTDIRRDMFKLLEDEREKIVNVLQDDIAQLISIANMQLAGELATQVSPKLSMALSKLRTLIFELKPDALKQLDLAEALTGLFMQRFTEHPNRFAISLHKLPQNMSSHAETAIFRVVQKALSYFAGTPLAFFELDINRKGEQILVTSRFELEPSEVDFTTSDFCERSLKEALNTLVYLFYGTMHCHAITDNQMEFIVILDENKL
ncbi:hypothetical protein [Mucilaginibacter lacusdianchii]|uniref:hypothetical protein n=1 Tax=Mucilaginibacter lacusdianchii TaxID=2684211 RepID=UPI00131AD090|nr:hypothetical protein [Mucilaginibacter sp. JXJ CY 39]